MKRYILPILLSAALMLPIGMSAESRGNHRQQHNTEKSGSSKRGNSSGRPGNSSRPGNNNNRPGGNNKPGNSNRPGNNGHHNNGYKPDHKPGGGSYGRPGGQHNPGPGFGHPPYGGSSVGAPGYRPGPGYHHPPRLGGMVRHAVGHGRYDRVWMVAPGQYAVRFYSGGRYYMQYIWPETGRYGNPFQIVMAAPGEWYAYGNRNQWYYDDGNSLRISLNGNFLNPWTLIPAIELNINL